MTLARLTPLVLVALLAASCSGKDKSSSPSTTATSSSSPSTTTTSSSTTTETQPSATPPANAGLTVGQRDLYPLLSGSLARYVSKPVTATSATIVQVAGIDSFWAGKNGNQQVLVKINLKGKRPPKLEEGEQVSFTGRFVKAPKSPDSLGVKAKTGAPQLARQGAYILVPVSKLHLE
jgi:hypothetical protein